MVFVPKNKIALVVCLFFVFNSWPVLASLDYQWDVSFENVNFLLSREKYKVNDQETVSTSVLFKYDDHQHWQLVLKPRLKLDFLDSERNRYIPNESYLKYYSQNSELTLGLQIKGWGISNAFNPTDVLNRKDLGDNLLTAEKLGDLILNYKYSLAQLGPFEDVSMEFLSLPFFMATPLPSDESRFAIQGEASGFKFTRYTSQDYPDFINSLGFGLRLSGTVKSIDAELLFYHGPEKQPTFFVLLDESLRLRAVPYYYLIDMVGTNLSKSFGPFMVHFESAVKITDINAEKSHAVPFYFSDVVPNSYWQFVPGVDYTRDGFSGATVVMSLEYLGENDVSENFEEFRPFKSDVFLGVRYEFNNTQLSRIQAGFIKDVLNSEMIIQSQFHTALFKGLGLDLEVLVINQDLDAVSPVSFFANNSYWGLNLNYALSGEIHKKATLK